MTSSLYLTTAAFVASLATASFSPAFVSPALVEGGGCFSGCEPAPKTKGHNGFAVPPASSSI